jgi:hypothetical protein
MRGIRSWNIEQSFSSKHRRSVPSSAASWASITELLFAPILAPNASTPKRSPETPNNEAGSVKTIATRAPTRTARHSDHASPNKMTDTHTLTRRYHSSSSSHAESFVRGQNIPSKAPPGRRRGLRPVAAPLKGVQRHCRDHSVGAAWSFCANPSTPPLPGPPPSTSSGSPDSGGLRRGAAPRQWRRTTRRSGPLSTEHRRTASLSVSVFASSS